MRMSLAATPLLACLALVAGCDVSDSTAPDAPATDAAPPAEATPANPNPAIARDVPQPQATPAIATQPGPHGTRVELQKIGVTGNLLTVQVRYLGLEKCCRTHSFSVDQVGLIDDATSQRYGVVRDDAGNWMASPVHGDRAQVPLQDDPVAWFKFPAPPAGTASVSLTIPDVAPFDGIPLAQ